MGIHFYYIIDLDLKSVSMMIGAHRRDHNIRHRKLDLDRGWLQIIPLSISGFFIKKNKNTIKQYAKKKITIHRRMRPID